NNHRGIRGRSVHQLDLKQSRTFVQEFIHNPLLIDGNPVQKWRRRPPSHWPLLPTGFACRHLDIGLYVTVASIHAPRVYQFDNEALLRFCAADYHPFNASHLGSYVVGDRYTPIWQIPSLNRYYTGLNTNMKAAFNAYIRHELGKDPTPVWQQMEESIKTI